MTLTRTGSAALAGVVAAVLAIAALLLAGLQGTELRTFALRVPDSQPPVAFAAPHHAVCEGPVRSAGPFRSVAVFGTYASGAPVVGVRVRSVSGHLLATGTLYAIARHPEQAIAIDREVSGRSPVRICVVAAYGRFALLGGVGRSSEVRTHGVHRGMQFALLLLRPASLLGSVGTVFARAAIFRPGWMGPWTFWTLLMLLVASVGLAVVAVAVAVQDDDLDNGPKT